MNPPSYHRHLFLDAVGALVVLLAIVFSLTLNIGASPFTEEQKLTASDGGGSDRFGYVIAMSEDGTRAVVGTDGTEGIYVFSRSGTTWTEEQKLTGDGGDYFG